MSARVLFGALALLCVAAGPPALPGDHEALARRFVAVLPADKPAEPSELEPTQAERQADLVKRYPAKAEAVRTAFGHRLQCSDAKRAELIAAMMLGVARSLTDEQLESLIAFYTGPDLARLDTLDESGPEARAMFERYPLQQFADAMKAYATAHLIEDVFAAEQACDAELDAALAKTGIQP